MADGKADKRNGRNESPATPRSSIKSGDKIVRIFDLFSAERLTISAAYVADRLQITASTAYRYLALLSRAGLVEHVAGGGYTLGPAIIEFDWLMRLSDRLLQESRTSMRWLLDNAPSGAAVLLCRLFRNQVMCVHQERDGSFTGELGYERGRPIPMFSGAASKIILGHLPRPTARALYADPRRAESRSGRWGSAQLAMSSGKGCRRCDAPAYASLAALSMPAALVLPDRYSIAAGAWSAASPLCWTSNPPRTG
jgi:DNA-binding IclR family transcriptional regulator